LCGLLPVPLLALKQGKNFAAQQQCVVPAVRTALATAGNAAGPRLALHQTVPKLFFVAGDLASVNCPRSERGLCGTVQMFAMQWPSCQADFSLMWKCADAQTQSSSGAHRAA